MILFKRNFIQLFATQTTLLNTTGNDLSPEMKTFYDKVLLRFAQPHLVHHQFGQKRDIPKNGGKTIEFRKFTPLGKALTPLTEGVTPAGNQLDVTALTATVQQYGDYIVLSDLLDLTALDNVSAETLQLLGDQAGITMDTVVRDALVQGTNILYAPKVSGSTETPVTDRAQLDDTALLTVDVVEQAVATLRAHNAPTFEDGYYHAIVHPYSVYTLRRDPDWQSPHQNVDTENLYNGEIGRIAGVKFFDSTEAKIFCGENLAGTTRNLAVNYVSGYSGAITGLTFDGGTVADDALIGRYININGVSAKITDNTSTTLTFASTNFGSISDNAVIYPGEGGKSGLAVFGTLIFGRNAYGVTNVEGAGLETIAKQKGSGGTEDPLNQRSSMGWKALEVAEILMQPYMVRIEHCNKRYSAIATGN